MRCLRQFLRNGQVLLGTAVGQVDIYYSLVWRTRSVQAVGLAVTVSTVRRVAQRRFCVCPARLDLGAGRVYNGASFNSQ